MRGTGEIMDFQQKLKTNYNRILVKLEFERASETVRFQGPPGTGMVGF